MESLVLLVFVVAWLLLGVLAIRFGHDSRDGIDRPPNGAMWHRPDNHPRTNRRRARHDRERAWEWPKVPQPPPRPALAAFSPNSQSPNRTPGKRGEAAWQ